MPLSFDQARQAAGIQPTPYVPLSVRENSGNTGLLSKIPGSYTAALADAQAPAKASGAPVAGTENVFVGLTTALNDYQQKLVKQKKRSIADQYAIEFAPTGVGASVVKRPGPQDATTAPMQTPDSTRKLDTATTSLNRDARTWPIKAGTQISKVIDDVMRNSSFITEQQNVEIDTAVDPITGIQTQTVKAKAGTGNMQWYKISVNVKDLGYDTVIRDHAYRMTFIITPYAIAQMTSQYFPDSLYRGVHKAYQYWFTGANTQVLQYEQNYNNAYRLFLSGIGTDVQKTGTIDFRDQNRYIYMATSPDQAQGAKNYANEPGDNAANFLYDPGSLSQVKMRIVGDPGWLQQGEVGLGVNAQTFEFKPFNADGSINFDSQDAMFSMAFNTPDDYDFNTGLVNVNKNNRNGQPQEYYTFKAIKVKSTFSKGRFEQELEGKLLVEKKGAPNAAGRPTASKPESGSRSNTLAQSQADAQDLENGANAGTGTSSTLPDDGSHGYAIQDETGQTSNIRKNEYGDLYYPAEPQPAAPPKPATSSGDVVPVNIPAPPSATPVVVDSGNEKTGFELKKEQALARAGISTPPQKMNKEY